MAGRKTNVLNTVWHTDESGTVREFQVRESDDCLQRPGLTRRKVYASLGNVPVACIETVSMGVVATAHEHYTTVGTAQIEGYGRGDCRIYVIAERVG